MSDFFDIDPNALDKEWVNQPRLYYTYASEAAEARDAWERAKAEKEVMEAEMEEAEAEVSLKIRRNPDGYNLEKVTEDCIKKTVLLQAEYKAAQRLLFQAQQKVIKAKSKLDLAEVAVKTLDHKKAALEDLVRLRLANYYAEPRDPSGGKYDKERGSQAFARKPKPNNPGLV